MNLHQLSLLIQVQCEMHAVNAEVAGMQAANAARSPDSSQAYESKDFQEKANFLYFLGQQARIIGG